MTVPRLSLVDFFDLAARLGCVGIELRNDLGRPLFDGMPAHSVADRAKAVGLRILGLSQVYPFNSWNAEREAEVKALINDAKSVGAETISLIPLNDGKGAEDGTRQNNLQQALNAILPVLQDAEMMALVEPLGFTRASLRSKSELVGMIEAIGGQRHFAIVHDTFHHKLAGGGPIYPDHTGIVHISGVVDPELHTDRMEDEHRVLVDIDDRLGNIEQIADLCAAGYKGSFSFECFSPAVHRLSDPYAEIKRSIEFVSSQIQAEAA